jgi:hypothetical protein
MSCAKDGSVRCINLKNLKIKRLGLVRQKNKIKIVG